MSGTVFACNDFIKFVLVFTLTCDKYSPMSSYKIGFGYDDDVKMADPGEDEDDYWPEGVPHNHTWNESSRDWIGDGAIDGLEGMMNINISYYGCTDAQRELIKSVMVDFGSEARELFQRLIDRAAGSNKAN